eukprot:TRINITY_DN2631_c0_g1_i1.p1 TRINITY_DN2631_c0_g1~~TRINITY_DN2631_c0_g1_i1.p1  ORF type:complete len:488 (+),score=87.75 TRINITY_DN2631_c0_g1_i1:93-1556(+)
MKISNRFSCIDDPIGSLVDGVDSMDLEDDPPSALKVRTELEKDAMVHNSVHKCWGMVTIKTDDIPSPPDLAVDLIILVDISASMGGGNKMEFIEKSMRFMLDNLHEEQNFSVIVFNLESRVLCDLVPCTIHNKRMIMDTFLSSISHPSGATNVCNGMETAQSILKSRRENRLSSIFLFSDGLSNHGDNETNSYDLPENCVFNAFGIGKDHDSALLSRIVMSTQGVYHYLENEDDIKTTFGECISGMLSTKVHSIVIKFRALDGARIVTLATPYKIKQKRTAKSYDIQMGCIFTGDERSVLFRLSLRKMRDPLNIHRLLSISIEYKNSLTGRVEIVETCVDAVRPAMPLIQRMPIALDQHINRYSAATALTEAIMLSNKLQFPNAQEKLKNTVASIKKSQSANTLYCRSLVADLNDVISNMKDYVTYQTGAHAAYAYSSMYYMERTSFLHFLRRNPIVVNVSNGYFLDDEPDSPLQYVSYYSQLAAAC